MSSILRPTPAQRTRRLVVLAAAVFAVVVPLVQNLAGLGLTQAEFAADGNQTLRVAGYAFSIWGLIYLGLLAYAVRQVLPQTGESVLINRMGWPSAVAFFGSIPVVVAALEIHQRMVEQVVLVVDLLIMIQLLVHQPKAQHHHLLDMVQLEEDLVELMVPLVVVEQVLHPPDQ